MSVAHPPAPLRRPNNLEGAAWMLVSAVTFALMVSLIKFLGEDYPAPLQNFYRQAAGLLFLTPLILRAPVRVMSSRRPALLIFRSAAGTVGVMLSMYSFQKLPLAEANAYSFTRVLWMVPLAWLVLRERVGPVRVAASVLGILGVLIILQPGGESGFGWPALAALASALLFALTVTGLKVMTREDGVVTLMAWSAVLGFLFCLPGAVLTWRWPEPFDLALLAAMGVLGVVTQGCYIRGMGLGDAAAMSPIDYTRLIFTAAFGLLFFQETPSAATLAGALVIVASTLWITWREAKITRAD